MPTTRKPRTYRLHKARNSAVVTIDGRNRYLGAFGSPESHEEYARLIAEWRAGCPEPQPEAATHPLTVTELSVSYMSHCEGYYRTPDGKPSSELHAVKQAIRIVREVYGSTDAATFGRLALKATREVMIERRWSRGNIDRTVDRMRRMFRWGVENELVPPSVYQH